MYYVTLNKHLLQKDGSHASTIALKIHLRSIIDECGFVAELLNKNYHRKIYQLTKSLKPTVYKILKHV